MTDEHEQSRLPETDGGAVDHSQPTIVDPNPAAAAVCGAAGCRHSDDLQTVETAAGRRLTICRNCRSALEKRGDL